MYRYKITLDTMSDINRFVSIINSRHFGYDVWLTDGNNVKVSAHSLLGAMYTAEWDKIICESDKNIYWDIQDFIVGEST